ncbi:ChbG/HpnK family deacetylase [Maribellus comscasis]|uniref:ChbG/HpnK family deacetylase n=1 Tax=Maribellus comscasis TaxID=2681766 RepID=A0A6I6K2A1_9BACT|nr:polysaccharide deacetylase family protein [Maribellus comscasis]QGY44034.1 ChbG/HpnK family deacetylase [Maribellus comscasis]
MKTRILSFLILFLSMGTIAQNDNQIYLLIRTDDIGSFHAANLACIETYQNGIAQSVELMAPCAWFLEATKMLNENPGFDVGIHLTLTSEWSNTKWRPLTPCPSLVDKDGYFFPQVWKNNNFPAGSSIQESEWKLDEIEQELRAQIEISLKHVPHISHISTHMGFNGLNPQIAALVNNLAKEYQLDINTEGLKRFSGWSRNDAYNERIDKFCENLEKLTPGRYLYVEHPGYEDGEMETVGHKGYEDVATDREWVTRVLTSDKVKETIQKKNIKLISYKDLKN